MYTCVYERPHSLAPLIYLSYRCVLYIYVCICIYMYTRMYTCEDVCVCIYAYIYIYMYSSALDSEVQVSFDAEMSRHSLLLSTYTYAGICK